MELERGARNRERTRDSEKRGDEGIATIGVPKRSQHSDGTWDTFQPVRNEEERSC